ncbi:MAG TPA: AI-2E family transporter [Chthoniobacterales bacterium]|nr:AI-2E family transporter [Chthoniobacterales bacterium]
MKNASTAALVGIWMILLTAFVVTILYVGRQLLIPLALAAMLTFLLAPLVGYIERWIGRIAAVLIVVAMLFSVVSGAGWLLTRQVIDLAAKLPDYQTNIDNKLRAIRLPTGGAFGRFSHSVSELQKQSPDSLEPPANATGSVPETRATTASSARNVPAGQQPMPVRIVESQNRLPQILQNAATGLLGPLGTAWLVFFLVIFMLLKREDLRGRMIRLIGQGRISATTRAMDDAGSRVARYLTMQFLVNVSFGICIAIGLYFIRVPNAALWGAFAAITRFVPYVGVWIAGAVPVLLSFAVSTSWLSPLLTIGLFVVLELISANALEPWLYGSRTGVSSIALIIAAVFWTWLWGPIGLVLATPLTVCVAVMGRHVPKLQFLSVLLSEEQALAPHEECYHRLLAFGLDEAHDLAEAYVKTNSLTSLYDSVLIPTVTLAEVDAQRDELDAEHRSAIHRHIHDLIEDLGSAPPSKSQLEADKTVAEQTPFPLSPPTCRVLCVPARAYRDELAGAMLVQLLRQQDFDAENASAVLSSGELIEMAAKSDPEAICISVVAPSTLIHARHLSAKLRAQLPHAKIVVGIWGATENMASAGERLRSSGADEVVVSLAEAAVQLAKFSVSLADEMVPGAIPDNEENRLDELARLHLADGTREGVFDRITKKLARIFEVPIALITFVDRDHQWFKSQVGLPKDLVEAQQTSRELSVCGHVVANDEVLVVEDLARDRRFANNPLLRERGLRFYAGVPLRSNNLPIGSLCVLDVKPRRMTEREKRLLEVIAEDVMEEIQRRDSVGPPSALVT